MPNRICFLPNLRQYFCKRYWKKTQNLSKRDYVEFESALYNVNLKLLTGTEPSSQEFIKRYELPFNKIIALTDKEFKALNKTRNAITVYRGIPEPRGTDKPILKNCTKILLPLKS